MMQRQESQRDNAAAPLHDMATCTTSDQSQRLTRFSVLLPGGPVIHLLHLAVRVGGVELGHVQALVDAGGDGLDVRHQLVLDGLQVVAVLRRDQVDGQAQMAEPP